MDDQTTAIIITSLLPADMDKDKPAIAKELKTELSIGTNIQILKLVLNSIAEEMQGNASAIKHDITKMIHEEFKNSYGIADVDRVYKVINQYFYETYGITK